MKQTPIKRQGKRSREREKGVDKHTPYLASRAGGVWLGWHTEGEHAVGVQCEICGAYLQDIMGHRAHIDERRGPKDDNIWNLIVACPNCHDHDKYPDGGLKCGTKEAKRLVAEKNEAMQ